MSFLTDLKRIINEEIEASQNLTAFKVGQLMQSGGVNGMGVCTAINQSIKDGVTLDITMNDGTKVTAVPGAGPITVGMACTVVGGQAFG